MSVTTGKRRARIHVNEHGGPEMPLEGPREFRGEEAIISAVPEANGKFAQGYVWIGASTGCFATVETERFLAFADALRKRK